MKKTLLILSIFSLILACKNTNPSGKIAEKGIQISENVISVDSFLVNPSGFVDQKVTVLGLAAHVCRHGGQKLFLVGNVPDKYLRINTGKTIPEFPIDLEGSTIEVKGTVTRFEEDVPESSEDNSQTLSESDTSRMEKAYHKDNFYVIVADSYAKDKQVD
jgi:hypothetical protein